MNNYRFYSFVAGHYLSPLQCGLQTAHAVSNMSVEPTKEYNNWAKNDKTIIICNAANSKGVGDTYEVLKRFGDLRELPVSIFHEDENSLNGAATACGIIVPMQYYYNVKFTADVEGGSYYQFFKENGETAGAFYEGSVDYEFISFLKSFRLV